MYSKKEGLFGDLPFPVYSNCCQLNCIWLLAYKFNYVNLNNKFTMCSLALSYYITVGTW